MKRNRDTDSEEDSDCDVATAKPAAKKKIPGREQKYKPEYAVTWKCLGPSHKGAGWVLCKICDRHFKCSHGGGHDCAKHIATQLHKDAEKKLSKTKSVPITGFFVAKEKFEETKNNLDLQIVKAEALMCELIVEGNLPLASADKFSKLFPEMFPDSKIASGVSCCRSKATAIIKEMSAQQMTSLASRMRSQAFSISTDGSNDADKKQYPLVVSIQGADGTVNSELLALRVCEDASTGQNIFNLVDSEFTAQNVPWSNCISLGCDNAAVMTGRCKGVIKFVREKQVEVHMSGCCLHLVHIAAKNGAHCVTDVEDVLQDIHNFFKKSVNRQMEFKELQTLYDLEQTRMLKHVCTRWLSIGRCLERLLLNWTPLFHFFHNEKTKMEKKKAMTNYSSSKVDSITLYLKSTTNRLKCHFLSYTVKVYDKVLLKLQAEEPMIHLLRQQLTSLIEDLFARFLLPAALVKEVPADGDLEDTSGGVAEKKKVKKIKLQVEEVLYKRRSNQKSNEDLVVGTEARRMLCKPAEHHLRDFRVVQFYTSVRSYFETVCEYLLNKLPLDDPVLKKVTVLDPNQQSSAKLSDLLYLLERFPALLPKGATVDGVTEQFIKYQSLDLSQCDAPRVDKFWLNVRAQEPELQELATVMAGLMTIPHSSAPCERVFSTVRKNATTQRASMGQSSLLCT